MYFLFFIFFKFFYNNSGIKPEFQISSPVIPKIRNSVFYKEMDSLLSIIKRSRSYPVAAVPVSRFLALKSIGLSKQLDST